MLPVLYKSFKKKLCYCNYRPLLTLNYMKQQAKILNASICTKFAFMFVYNYVNTLLEMKLKQIN